MRRAKWLLINCADLLVSAGLMGAAMLIDAMDSLYRDIQALREEAKHG